MKANHEFTNERMSFKVWSVTIDTSMTDEAWNDFKGYTCPVLVIPAHFITSAKWEVINNKPSLCKVRVNSKWYNVCSTNDRVGKYRVPTVYPNTRVEKIMTSSQISNYLAKN